MNNHKNKLSSSSGKFNHGIKAKKYLGQHFLNDEVIAEVA